MKLSLSHETRDTRHERDTKQASNEPKSDKKQPIDLLLAARCPHRPAFLTMHMALEDAFVSDSQKAVCAVVVVVVVAVAGTLRTAPLTVAVALACADRRAL